MKVLTTEDDCSNCPVKRSSDGVVRATRHTQTGEGASVLVPCVTYTALSEVGHRVVTMSGIAVNCHDYAMIERRVESPC